jgi:hypothetical protein
VPALLLVRFPRPLAEPGVRLSPHRALHGVCRGGRSHHGEAWPASPIPAAADPPKRARMGPRRSGRHHSVARLSASQPPIRSRHHCRPSPCARLSRTPRQVVTPATTTAAPPHPEPVNRRCAQPRGTSLAATTRADPGWFPCSLVDRSTEEAPDSAPATSPWLPRSTSPRPPHRHADPPGSSPPP